ncbi:Putative amidase, partial [Termitomyces sp. J132]
AYFARIEEVNLKGPFLRAVLETNPTALSKAAELDSERQKKVVRSALHGIPVLLKDNIATVASEGMDTTAGSFGLQHSIVPDDAWIVKRLRAAGAIILGKTNLSELAHYRGKCASGWSGVGGQTTNAYYPSADPSGSSSGSGVAVSIGLAAVAIGTETNGSIISPTSHNNIVGIKPTVGLTSRAGVVPISSHQDTVGPMTRCVADAAAVLSVIAGKDPNDSDTLSQPDIVPDFTQALNSRAFEGKRIGVPRRVFFDDENGSHPEILPAFEEALEVIRSLGATVVDPADLPSIDEIKASKAETIVLDADFKIGLNKYLSHLLLNPSGVRTMADLIKFNDDNPDLEKPEGFEDQSILIRSEATTGHDSTFAAALAMNRDLGGTRGIDAALQKYKLDALILPSDGLTSTPPGMHNCTLVPLGFFSENVAIGRVGPRTVYPAPGVPFGLSFLGPAFSESDLIGFAYAYEMRTTTRHLRKAFPAAIPKTQLKDILNLV